MDYDNDGILDFISGSYDPGDLYLFRGEGKGKYAKVQQILDQSGTPVVHHPEEFAKYQKMKDDKGADPDESINARVASFGSWVAPVDWENDGDLDLLIGSFGGDLFLRKNEGSRSQPTYDTKSIPVHADGKPLHVNLHADPVVADWNNDGLWDLVVGASDGAVGWFANIGSKTEPKFGPYQALIAPASDTKFLEQNLGPNDTPIPAVRTQICVTDYNHDGMLDLVVGDYSDINWKREMNASEEAELADLMDFQTKLISYVWKLRGEWSKDPQNEQPKKKIESLQKEFEKLERRTKPFFSSNGSASFIWLFLRTKSTSSKASGPSESPRDGSTSQSSTSRQNPVSIDVHLARVSGLEDQWDLTAKLSISPGWHIYASVSDNSTAKAVSVNLELPTESGVQQLSAWERPKGVASLKEPSNKIYEGQVAITQRLKISKGSSGQALRVVVKYQACTDQYCLPPGVIQKEVAVP